MNDAPAQPKFPAPAVAGSVTAHSASTDNTAEAPEANGPRYSVKMRASARTQAPGTRPKHISGAERIVEKEEIDHTALDLAHRALNHPNGAPDDVTISLHRVEEEDIVYLRPLSREVHRCPDVASARRDIVSILAAEGVADPEGICDQLTNIRGMRGAMMVDAETGARRDTKDERGVRVTALDNDLPAECMLITGTRTKPYYYEALTLATKVAAHPAVVAEVCISDDLDYTTGYVATSDRYIRIENIKPAGSPQGGRIFLVRGTDAEIADCIHFLENTPVIVRGIPRLDQIDPGTVSGNQGEASASADRGANPAHPAVAGNGAAESASPATGPAPTGAVSASTAPTGAVSASTSPTSTSLTKSQSLTDFASQSLAAWESAGLRRRPLTFSTPQLPHSVISGREMLLFSSSNYLGLGEHPALIHAAEQALKKFGAGSGGSRLTTGNTVLHEQAERDIADFTGYEDAVLFGTGFQANGGVLSALALELPQVANIHAGNAAHGDSDASANSGGATPAPMASFHPTPAPMTIFSDALNHASLIDGTRMAARLGATTQVYAHNDLTDLAQQLASNRSPRKLIISDGVFSMDGDIAHLPALMRLAREHGAWVMIDDAHGTGTLGPTGRGTMEYWADQLSASAAPTPIPEELRPDILLVTASKALGVEGAAVCCAHVVAEFLRNRSRGYIFSTSSSPATAAAISAAIRTIVSEPQRVYALQENAQYLRHELRKRGIPLREASTPEDSGEGAGVGRRGVGKEEYSAENATPIIPILIGAEDAAMRISAGLAERGIHVPAIRYPTVKRGEAILRVTVMATHRRADIDRFVAELADLWRG